MKARCYISLQMDVAQDLIYITSHSLRKKCWMESYSVGMLENTDQNNSEYGQFLRSSGIYSKLLMTLFLN